MRQFKGLFFFNLMLEIENSSEKMAEK